MKKLRTEITIEVEDLMLIRSRGRSLQLWCPACGADVEMVTPSEAARIAGVTSRTIYRWVEQARLHFVENAGGSILVCVVSLDDDANQSGLARRLIEALLSLMSSRLRN
ncbi:MAG TPA: helix-turn-helix domain-containing protein [Acidobacteriota bacterium]|nr:helix-turn-helix domain-containing protein [Acidobacteriota bacterium]